MFKYDYLNKVQIDLLEKGVLQLIGDVDKDMLSCVGEAMARLVAKGNPDIEVWISSPGGSVEYGLYIYDILRLYQGKRTGKVTVSASSMAAIILQACDVRQCARHATILIHHISRTSVNLDDLRSKARRKKIIDDLEKSQERLYAIIEERTKKDRNTIKAVCEKDEAMSSEEALEFGLIDEVI